MLEVVESLYAARPSSDLYHYTSIGSLQEIVKTRSIWATEIRYLNDAKEVIHTLDMFLSVMRTKHESSNEITREFLRQLERWLRHRLVDGHLVFAVSLSEHGNLLSQWRAYSPVGKGVSAGFDRHIFRITALRQGYRLGKCLYDDEIQKRVIQDIFWQIEKVIIERGPENDVGKRASSNSYHGIFEEFEDDLLMCAALLKHPAFREEAEWRAVSSVVKRYAPSDIQYREGRFCLVPYRQLSLVSEKSEEMPFKEVFVGPTPSTEQSIKSLGMFLSNHGLNPRVTNSLIPYRLL